MAGRIVAGVLGVLWCIDGTAWGLSIFGLAKPPIDLPFNTASVFITCGLYSIHYALSGERFGRRS